MGIFFFSKKTKEKKTKSPVFVTHSPLTSRLYDNIFFTKGRQMEAKSIQKRLGQRIREHRNLLGLSQEKFALLIGMDRTYLASVETGNRNISIVNIQKISKGLNISLSQLFENI